MIENTQIGKITNAGTLVSGGRIDQYWADNGLDVDFSISDSNKKHNNLYNINPDIAIEEFGFKSMEFGNWLNQSERAFFLYNSTVSFSHLSNIFNIPHKLVGFNGKLSIAFGARGSGNALAHYERLSDIIINLTKDGGHHSLAHEYGHAIDNLIGFYVNGIQGNYLSGGSSTRSRVDEDKALSENYFIFKMEQLFEELYFNKDGTETNFLKNIKAHKKSDYLSQRTEVFARTFEVYVHNKLVKSEIDNEFLTRKDKFKGHYPVLSDNATHILDALINNAFQVFSEKAEFVKGAAIKNKSADILQLGAVEVLSQNGKQLLFNGHKPTYKILDSYDHLIKGSNSVNESKIVARGGLDATTKAIKDVIVNYNHQLVDLANHLKADSLKQSTFNIWHFIKKNIKYDFDLAGVEEIRTPARTWKDRFYRSDCEDYAIFASALLLNMGYTPTLRIVAFNNKDYFQHIYVVINGITIDPVLNKFNIDPENITKVMDIKVLSGLGAIDKRDVTTEKLMINQSAIIKEHRKTKCSNKKKALMRELRKVRYLLVIKGADERDQILPIMSKIHDITADGKFIFKKNQDLESVADYLEMTNNLDDQGIVGLGAVNLQKAYDEIELENLNKLRAELRDAVANNKVSASDVALTLTNIDEILSEQESVSGLSGNINFALFAARLKAAKTAKDKGDLAAAKSLASSAMASLKAANAQKKKSGNVFSKVKGAVKNTIKNPIKSIKTAAGKVATFIKKFNPLSVLARNSYLGLLRLNFKGWGENYAKGYTNSSVLRKKGYSATDISNIYKRHRSLEKFWKDFGGNTGSLKKAILASKKAKAQLSGLGADPITVSAAALAAATPIIIKVKKIMDSVKIAKDAVGKGKSIINKAKGTVSNITNKSSFVKNLLSNSLNPSGENITEPSTTSQNVRNESEQNFINNELVNDTVSDSGEKKDNTMLWVAAASVVGIGLFALKN